MPIGGDAPQHPGPRVTGLPSTLRDLAGGGAAAGEPVAGCGCSSAPTSYRRRLRMPMVDQGGGVIFCMSEPVPQGQQWVVERAAIATGGAAQVYAGVTTDPSNPILSLTILDFGMPVAGVQPWVIQSDPNPIVALPGEYLVFGGIGGAAAAEQVVNVQLRVEAV